MDGEIVHESGTVHRHDGRDNHDKHAGHSPQLFRQKFWISVLLTLPILVVSPSVQTMVGIAIIFPGRDLVVALLGVVLFFVGGTVFIRSARAELAMRRPGMMTLISMAISVAFVYSLAVTLGVVRGGDFWWELATLISIMLLGHWMEMSSIERATGALHELASLLPDEAEVIEAGESRTVPVGELEVGQMVLVRPGGRVPIDGVVRAGESDVDESLLTGESKAVKKTIGSSVVGGSINQSGALTIEVVKVGDDTTLAGIMKLVADAQASKSAAQVLADRAAGYLVYVAIAAAGVTAVGWALAGANAGFVLERVVAVLIIACPHALGLAIPLVTAIATTKAARSGLLIRDRRALEEARRTDIVLFDKTGTLTKGEQGVVGVVAAEGNDQDGVLALAAAVEKGSEHSIAHAIYRHAQEKSLTVVTAYDFTALPGRGAAAMIDGGRVEVGGPGLLAMRSLVVPDLIVRTVDEASEQGKTVVYVVRENRVAGAIMLADVIREESRVAVQNLQERGVRVAMLTGDSQGVAGWVAKELGIADYFAGVLPEHKAEVVKKFQDAGKRVIMVGDGINDAPALTRANVGVAIGAGTDVAIESAGIILLSSDPQGVAKILTLSEVTYRKMIQNLLWATGYNIVAIPMAAGVTAGFGYVMSPAVGAVLMSISTIIVALNAQLLRRVAL